MEAYETMEFRTAACYSRAMTNQDVQKAVEKAFPGFRVSLRFEEYDTFVAVGIDGGYNRRHAVGKSFYPVNVNGNIPDEFVPKAISALNAWFIETMPPDAAA